MWYIFMDNFICIRNNHWKAVTRRNNLIAIRHQCFFVVVIILEQPKNAKYAYCNSCYFTVSESIVFDFIISDNCFFNRYPSKWVSFIFVVSKDFDICKRKTITGRFRQYLKGRNRFYSGSPRKFLGYSAGGSFRALLSKSLLTDKGIKINIAYYLFTNFTIIFLQ